MDPSVRIIARGAHAKMLTVARTETPRLPLSCRSREAHYPREEGKLRAHIRRASCRPPNTMHGVHENREGLQVQLPPRIRDWGRERSEI